MKKFNRQTLPDSIEYNGKTFYCNISGSHLRSLATPPKFLRGQHVEVHVLSRNLKGKTDLHGKPYQPSVWIFSTELGKKSLAQ